VTANEEGHMFMAVTEVVSLNNHNEIDIRCVKNGVIVANINQLAI